MKQSRYDLVLVLYIIYIGCCPLMARSPQQDVGTVRIWSHSWSSSNRQWLVENLQQTPLSQCSWSPAAMLHI